MARLDEHEKLPEHLRHVGAVDLVDDEEPRPSLGIPRSLVAEPQELARDRRPLAGTRPPCRRRRRFDGIARRLCGNRRLGP